MINFKKFIWLRNGSAGPITTNKFAACYQKYVGMCSLLNLFLTGFGGIRQVIHCSPAQRGSTGYKETPL